MPFSIISAGVSRLLFIGLGTQPQGSAHLIESHLDPAEMNLESTQPPPSQRKRQRPGSKASTSA
jgi:hypothetical protein